MPGVLTLPDTPYGLPHVGQELLAICSIATRKLTPRPVIFGNPEDPAGLESGDLPLAEWSTAHRGSPP